MDELAALAQPDLLPHAPPPPGWVPPIDLDQTTTSGQTSTTSTTSTGRQQRWSEARNPGLEVADDWADHYLGLFGAHIVATDALLMVRDNLADVVTAKAMMCVHGAAGLGKTLSVNASLHELAADAVCRVQFRARPTPRSDEVAGSVTSLASLRLKTLNFAR